MLKVAVGHSNDPDSLEAVNEVLTQCQETLEGLEGANPKAGVLFAAIDFDHQLIVDCVNAVFPGIELIGGTTDGEVSSILGFQQDSLTLMLFCAEDIEFCAAVGRNVSQAPLEIAQQTAERAKQQLLSPLKLCITTPESLTTSASSILDGLTLALAEIPVLGGTTGDQTHIQRTFQFFKTEVLSDAVPILLLGGNLLFSHGVSSGWSPLGKQSIVTKVKKNVIYEIDGKPALDFYHYYFHTFAADLAYPLAIFPPGEETFVLRAALSNDAALGSISVSADVIEGSRIQMTEASQEEIICASKISFEQAWDTYPGNAPTAALFFSCAWRRFILGTQTMKEYEAIAQLHPQKPASESALTKQAPLCSCGFYTYGEISPLRNQGPTFFHNTTFVTLLLGSE
jgi:hypothetical protein